jgi:hypothetical protein
VVRADAAGLPVDKAMRGRLQKVLEQALRSDYPHLFNREGVRERVAALWALAEGGDLQPAYATELARRAGQFATESVAEIAAAIQGLPAADHALLPPLESEMWNRVQTRLLHGNTIYAGLTDQPADPLILPSETRGLAEVIRAVAVTTPQEPRLALLRTGLLRIADGDGWGSTNATAFALRALAASWQKPGEDIPVSFALPGAAATQGVISAATPLVEASTAVPGAITITTAGTGDTLALPTPLGAVAKAAPHGFVVGRSFFRVPATGPMERLEAGADGSVALKLGDVVEEVDEVVNPEPRTNVAWRLPMAAGMEPLNPNLATSAANAQPSAGPTLSPDYEAYGDDQVLVVYMQLPQGTFTFRSRMRATVPGRFTAPPASAETMYQAGVIGYSDGARLAVNP